MDAAELTHTMESPAVSTAHAVECPADKLEQGLEQHRRVGLAALEALVEAQCGAERAAEARRNADLEAAVEAKHRAELASLEARRKADVAALEVKRHADVAQLEAKRDSDLAALATDVANRLPRRPSNPSLSKSSSLSWLPSRPSSARISPAAFAVPKEGPRLVPRWRIAIVLCLVLTSGAAAAFLTLIGRNIIERRSRGRDERRSCHEVRDRITNWGKRRAVEASTLCKLMLIERNLGVSPNTPFLVPGSLARALQVERLELLAEEFQEVPPAVVWYPTVRLEDRAAYEAYAGEVYGMPGPMNITDADSSDDLTLGVPLFGAVTAPLRPTYNPFTFIWAAALPDAIFTVRSGAGFRFLDLVGVDVQERYRRTLPSVLKRRFFDERSLVAHPWYLPSGAPLVDFLLTLRVPCVDPGNAYDPVLGYVSFSLHASSWSSTFPDNVRVAMASTGDVVKTASHHKKHAHAYEPFLDLDLECTYDVEGGRVILFVGLAFSNCLILALLLLLRYLELAKARARCLADERRRAAAASASAEEERIRYGFAMSEKTERYLNHELKNRIFVLAQACADKKLHGQIDEITEVLNNKAVLMRLSTRRYTPSWGSVELAALVNKRWHRFNAANNPFDRAETTGAAAHRKVLLLDTILFNIILDNMLSNAFKYGDAARPPALSLNVEPLDEGASRVRLSLELRNWAGPEHEALLEMGEEELNEIALTEGRRAHDHAAELSSGDGFPMAAAAASALGGNVRLFLLPDGVLAKLELPDVEAVGPGAVRRSGSLQPPADLSWLKIAMADDSAMFRKMIAMLAEKLTSREPFVAGATRESIDDFPKTVVANDVDVVLLDFNFAPVHHTKTGVDLCRECRELDAEAGNVPRVIFIVSANDSPEDAERYRAAGADGSLGKKMSVAKLRRVLEDAVRTHPRFAARRDAAAAEARRDAAAEARKATSPTKRPSLPRRLSRRMSAKSGAEESPLRLPTRTTTVT
ncbi:hypothetical protein M885DRAFT_611754 [Pelagophyceae sp. CCMP2097]|nr:hypothetical protein M885DRAFT_611754 [Pelagophyceae sp. CCMP2097]